MLTSRYQYHSISPSLHYLILNHYLVLLTISLFSQFHSPHYLILPVASPTKKPEGPKTILWYDAMK